METCPARSGTKSCTAPVAVSCSRRLGLSVTTAQLTGLAGRDTRHRCPAGADAHAPVIMPGIHPAAVMRTTIGGQMNTTSRILPGWLNVLRQRQEHS